MDQYRHRLSQFATGMNGDEDLGQNIIMKGDKYHYNQALAQGVDTEYHYNNSMGYRDPTNVVRRDGSGKAMDQYRHRLSQFATGMNGDEDLG
jgi:hypothetical protein